MKRIFVTFLLVPILTFSQDKVSQDKEVNELRNDLNIVKENLDLHHKQFISGGIITFIGSAVVIVGAVTATPLLIMGGGVFSLCGYGVMIDSDKWFGKRYMDEDTRERKRGTVKGEISKSSNPEF